jgi:flagellar hook protein FlgE
VTQLQDNPVATQKIDFKANLPTQPNPSLSSTGNTYITMPSQQVTVYDAQGTAHTIDLNYNYTSSNPTRWNVSFSTTDPAIASVGNSQPWPVLTQGGAAPASNEQITVNLSGAASPAKFEFLYTGDTPTAGYTSVNLGAAPSTAAAAFTALTNAMKAAGISFSSTGGVIGATSVADTGTGVNIAASNPVAIDFNPLANPPAGSQAGSIAQINGVAGVNGMPVSLPLQITYNVTDPTTGLPVAQTVAVNLGSYGVAEGLTEFTGTDINFQAANQDGLPPGSFQSLSFDDEGMLTLNYTNGNKKTVYQVPVAKFENYDGLQSKSGNAWTSTAESGAVTMTPPGANGSGSIVPSGVEASTVDISAEFTKMIEAQRAYSANSKVITVTNEMFQDIEQVVR